MKSLSFNRNYEIAENDVEATPLPDLNKEFATGPLKPAKCECCQFRSRIPHYLWTSHVCQTCSCSFNCAQHRYRTCLRLGNFTVVLERFDANGDGSELCLVVGPHWPFALLFTCGITISFPSISIYVFWGILPNVACYFLIAISCLVLVLLVVLGCQDPGIAKRLRERPMSAQDQFTKWVWNDQASTWRTTTDSYSHEMNVVIHDVDHVCPFTGTAISRKNIAWFLAFQVAVIALGFSLVIFIVWGLFLISY
mmetsp:Transcript_5652/g.7021  ORF Transcript_5652/g.7021 Transcript_5652/m.7021 type:complete len:252 (+) Transcript_5652:74-829(+)